MPAKKKPLHETRAYLRRQAGIQKKKRRHKAMMRRREIAGQAKKMAVEVMAEEAFGEGGLTPARLEALTAVVAGPDAVGQLSIKAPTVLRKFIKDARAKLHKHAENYVNIHLASTTAAHAAGEYDVAARHAEWALEALGEGEERVIEPAPKGAPPAPAATPILVGVSLAGGLPQQR